MQLPSQIQVDKFREEFWKSHGAALIYIKLHGSFGWRSQDGSNVMVIGQGKEGMIEKEPLLHWYISLFSEILNYRKSQKLVVIGYGFGDEHINTIIADAINHQDLKLFVVSPQSPAEFYNDLCPLHGFNVQPKPKGTELWNGLYQYWPAKVTDFVRRPPVNKLSPRGEAFFRGLRLG